MNGNEANGVETNLQDGNLIRLAAGIPLVNSRDFLTAEEPRSISQTLGWQNDSYDGGTSLRAITAVTRIVRATAWTRVVGAALGRAVSSAAVVVLRANDLARLVTGPTEGTLCASGRSPILSDCARLWFSDRQIHGSLVNSAERTHQLNRGRGRRECLRRTLD